MRSINNEMFKRQCTVEFLSDVMWQVTHNMKSMALNPSKYGLEVITGQI